MHELTRPWHFVVMAMPARDNGVRARGERKKTKTEWTRRAVGDEAPAREGEGKKKGRGT